jgi:putative nucleotidyltransferase with HDIG domain
LLDLSRAYAQFLAMLNSRSQAMSLNVDDSYNIGRHFIIPNLYVNNEEIQLRREAAMADVSVYSEEVTSGDVIVHSGDQITARQAKILEEMYRQQELSSGEKNRLGGYLAVLARLMLVLAAFLILYLYLYHYHRQVYKSNPKLMALFCVYGLALLLIYMLGIKLNLPIYVYPVAIFSILVTVLFDAEIGVVSTFVLALLLGVLHRFNFPIVLITMIIGVVSCFSIQGVRQRSEFFRSIMFLSIVYIMLTLILESFNVAPSDDIWRLVGFSLANAILSPILAMGILPVFESLFGFTTNVTLLELSDLNRPLLKRLAQEAPGTYHHSILVGNLAEAAAKAINANPLLARVGAYYHDIGKMEIPEYFVENQLGIKSRHEKLTPTMSAIILASHLKKGRVIGENADLPDEVLNFIEEHHGTMTMTYFYNKAKELGDDKPAPEDFRYSGPKPQIRETAVVMLADSVEAASRTLSDPKPARIRNLVQNIINDRFQSGELEDCPLTLRDLAQIRESFVQILIGVFHHRVEYPKDEKLE